MSIQNGTAISPNLLMNFDPYSILQPLQNPQVARLIDVGDVTTPEEVNASFYDQKPKYDLVDLLQNLYVTPELVDTSSNASQASTFSVNNETRSADIDFTDFFDKLEAGEKIDENAKKESKKHNPIEMVRQPRSFVPKVMLDDESDDEYLIEEILAKKNAERRMDDEMETKTSPTTVQRKVRHKTDDALDLPSIKVLSVPTDIALKVSTTFKDTKAVETNTSILKNVVSPTGRSPVTATRTNPEIGYDLITQLSCLNLNNTLTKDLNDDGAKAHSSPVKLDKQINNSLHFNLIAIKKDEKVYKKKRILKPESQTCHFTKGADFYEKSVVLPQIMERIMERKAFLEERNNQKRRLTLDTGVPANVSKLSTLEGVKNSKKNEDFSLSNLDEVKNGKKNVVGSTSDVKKATGTDNSWGKVNPIVLMADCNKERLKAFEQGRMFQNFIRNSK